MKGRLVFAMGAAVLVAGGVAAVRLEPIGELRAPAPVVFVCRNGVAMSLWSAAHFNRLAAERGVPVRAVARATLPSYSDVPFRMRLALALDGFRLGGFLPRVIDEQDARPGALVVEIGDAALSPGASAGFAQTETWQGFPPMREDYFPSRAALELRVEALVERLAAHHVERGRPAAIAGQLTAE